MSGSQTVKTRLNFRIETPGATYGSSTCGDFSVKQVGLGAMLFGSKRGKVMPPKKFVGVLDRWVADGGAFPEIISGGHRITTAAEAEAVCRALCSKHIYTPNSIQTPALFDLAAYFQNVEGAEAEDVLRCQGLPLLRRILSDAMEDTTCDMTDYGVGRRIEAQLFILKILASCQHCGDASLFIRAARDPRISEGDLWIVIFEIVHQGHPAADKVYEELRHPLPDRRAGVGYLVWANTISLTQPMSRHPFDTEPGIARLLAYLADCTPDDYVPALCAARGIAFVEASARDRLIGCADQHPNGLVRMEAAISLARSGSDFGWQRLSQLCLNPRFAYRAVEALRELGLESHIPAKASDPDFQAMAEMCEWLRNPMEFARPPDEIMLYDTRELNWPPTEDRRRLWLFKYRFLPEGEGEKARDGVGMVGSTTFSLVGTTDSASPEDVYGLHCCWELALQEDSRAASKSSAALGRKMLAAVNPDFPIV
jgi:hypothetical protein